MKSEEKMIRLLLRSNLFRDFSVAELMEMLPQLAPELKRLERGEVLVQIHDPAQRVGMVLSGALAVCRSGEGARVHDLSRRKPDDVFGLTALFSGPGRSPVTISAATDAEVLLFDIRPLLENAQYKDRIKDAALLIVADHSTCDILKMDVLLSPSMRGRIMTYFRTIRDQYGNDIIQIKLTQTELADYLGVNRSALSRELNKMQREGILKILPNRRYHVMNWKSDLPDIRQDEQRIVQSDRGKDQLQ